MSGLTRIEMDAMRAIEGMNRKMKDQREIDWEQRRYEIARECLPLSLEGVRGNFTIASKEAVAIADALINELKGGSK